jgi:hypothetical protein
VPYWFSLVSERATLALAEFTIAYIVFTYNTLDTAKRKHLIMICISLLVFAYIEFSTLSNLWYNKGTFFPSSLDELIDRFQNPAFVENTIVFLIFNFFFLGVFALFRWKLFFTGRNDDGT